jgi:hypothetical protein
VNAAESWLPVKPLHEDDEIIVQAAAVDGSGYIWLATRDGVYRSTNAGDSWRRIASLRLSNLANIQFDPEGQRILVTGADSNTVYESSDSGRTWNPINSGWPLRNVRSVHGRLLGTTPFDGVIIQPETAVSEIPSGSEGTLSLRH